MKKLLLIAAMVLCLASFFGCAESMPEVNINAEEVLRTVVENIDWEELKGYAEKGADALMEKFPALKTLADKEKMQEILKDHGLKVIREYLNSTDAEVQESAEKLGAIIKILSPELTDEVDAVFAEYSNYF